MLDANAHIRIYPSKAALAEAAAHEAARLMQAIPESARFSLALSGGSTPEPFHRALATQYRDAIPWTRVHLFWGDDRFVPHDDVRSNVRTARETLIDAVPIPAENVHPIPCDGTPEDAADAYEATLRAFFGNEDATFDLMLMGMGDDGHTASLFPGYDAVHETERWVVATPVSPTNPPVARVTMTLPLIRSSRHVYVLIAGANKRDPLRHVLAGADVTAYPAAGIQARDTLVWFLDEAAADLG